MGRASHGPYPLETTVGGVGTRGVIISNKVRTTLIGVPDGRGGSMDI